MTVFSDTKPAWVDRRACKDATPCTFFEVALKEGQNVAKGKPHLEVREKFCAQCPVRRDCLKGAMVAEGKTPVSIRYGLYGGLTPAQRAALAKNGKWQCPQCSATLDPFGLIEGYVVCDCGFESAAPSLV